MRKTTRDNIPTTIALASHICRRVKGLAAMALVMAMGTFLGPSPLVEASSYQEIPIQSVLMKPTKRMTGA